MPCCQFLLIVIVTAIILIYKEFLKNSNMSKMLLRNCFVKLWIFLFFLKRLFDVIFRWRIYGDEKIYIYIKECSLKDKYLLQITPKGSQSSLQISGNLSQFAICSSLRTQWRLTLATIIHCCRLRLWGGCFIYFKITFVFF